ncbi:hypothetical protein BD779DRAFT_1781240 [Infundibulicybe gibba]|nr:hypothetical protein BD779DRAFT_1781240 [Infundibulicybe gibba]
MAHEGLLQWVNDIRYTMSTDPGRQLFQDEIQTHGFDFLDNYLGVILSGAKQEPLIELVKTPGRKRTVKKPKTASKLNHVISLSFEAGSDGMTQDGAIPVNSFHRTLLETIQPKPATILDNAQDHAELDLFREETHLEGNDSSVQASSATPIEPTPPPLPVESLALPEKLIPVHVDNNDLSIIAEGDEPVERSRMSIRHPSPEAPTSTMDSVPSSHVFKTNPPSPTEKTGPSLSLIPPEPSKEVPQVHSNNSSIDTLHSIALDSPQAIPPTSQEPIKIWDQHPLQAFHSPVQGGSVSQPLLGQYGTSQLSIPPWQPRKISGNSAIGVPSTALPPTSTSTTIRDVEMHPYDANSSPLDDHAQHTTHDAVIPHFPTLPAPIPLRKPRDPSVGSGPLAAATPGAAVGGKRTSWLMKAREVKALEVTGKKITVIPPNPMKRKSGDMLKIPGIINHEEEPRRKISKTVDSFSALATTQPTVPPDDIEAEVDTQSGQTADVGVLDLFKKTIEGLGARVGKSTSKSFGGSAANALAEAKAAAEVRVAERNHKEEEMTIAMRAPFAHQTVASPEQVTTGPSTPEPLLATISAPLAHRLSLSELSGPRDQHVKDDSHEKVFTPPPDFSSGSKAGNIKTNRESTTTTPPNSPPAIRANGIAPPPNKPPPVFAPPESIPKAYSAATLQMPASMSLGLAPRLHSPPSYSKKAAPLIGTSTLESIHSESFFEHKTTPSWTRNIQDTQHSPKQLTRSEFLLNQLDEDDSWPIDEKLATGVPWTFGTGGSKEDSLTWSTFPSQSQRLDNTLSEKQNLVGEGDQKSRIIPGAFDDEMDIDSEQDDIVADSNSDLENLVMGAGHSTVNLVETKPSRSEGQMSLASSASSHVGFLGQASKLLSSALGTNKKGDTEVKRVLKMAAVAAKKQQEETDKKAARLKEMENRRQQAIQRKAEEEKIRSQEEERKRKEESERRKREREEHTDKKPLKPPGSKKDEDNTKKRKLLAEPEKKAEIKKPIAPAKPVPPLKSALKQPAALSSSAAYNASLQSIAVNTTSAKPTDTKSSKSAQKSKSKAPAKTPVPEDDISQPSQIVHSQMAARAKAQLQAANVVEPPSESIELPDINSEYSDSEDEDRPRTFDPPDWAQSPDLRQALQMQSTINPDDIFGAIRPLRMEEIFRNRASRFRARTSSANWTGADRLTAEEEREYARRMGFR